MTDPAPPLLGPVLRWSRAGVVAAMALAIGTVAHTAAGGLLPGAPTLLGLLVVLTALCAAALTRPASYAVLAGLVVGGQVAVHVVLTAMSGHPGSHAASSAAPDLLPINVPQSGVRHALSVVDTPAQVVAGPVVPHWVQHLLDDLTGANLAMSVAHAIAAAAVAGWLLVGERALVALVLMVAGRLELGWQTLRASWWASGSTLPSLDRSGTAGEAVGPDRLRRSAAHGPTGRRGPPHLPGPLLPSPTT